MLAVAVGVVHSRDAGPFVFATPAQARAVLAARDDYVRATAPLERSAKLRTPETIGAERFVDAMRETALDWTQEEQRAFAAVLAALGRFISAMRWKAPTTILMVKASDKLLDGFPHTRGNAIVLQEGMLQQALANPELMSRESPRHRRALAPSTTKFRISLGNVIFFTPSTP